MPDSTELEKLLNWIQAVVVHPRNVEAAMEDPRVAGILDLSAADIERVLVPSRTLTAAQRIAIYANMYPLRMRDALATDYPVLEEALGEHGWAHLVDDYVQDHPSRNQSLNHLGKHLPEWMRTTPVPIRTQEHEDGVPSALRQFLAELARLELAMTLVFDAPRSPSADVASLANLPPEAWGDAVFVPIQAFRLEAFHFPVNAWFQAVKDEKPRPDIHRKQTYVAVYRKDYRVWRMDLSREQYRILSQLLSGKPVADALLKATKGGGSEIQALAQNLRRWFHEWFQEGWFARIDVPPAA